MQKGEFDNLSGKGKPLESSNHNPLLDVTTQNINRILVDNGYAPEWVMLQAEIRYSISMLYFRIFRIQLITWMCWMYLVTSSFSHLCRTP